ncbi:Uncharacterised protein [Mycobacteroides abscessus subsp. bolletii]|uniref:hypothetical protein n=1 Tax=Mycobacteroides abscessus TaxID=36809 RepID=UPI0009A7DBB3|nr:hypothetical protein [Mycobacteroides abscessus]SLD50605.1 Uncharacterised protein [Mycobacteroides abscessus subsp. bolletii]
MSRGKYGAKAANRLAELDSEIVRGLRSEIDGLKRRNAELEAVLADQAVRTGSEVIARADELAAELVKQAHAAADQVRQSCEQRLRETADWLLQYTVAIEKANPEVKVVPEDIDKVLARLIGPANVGRYLAKMPGFKNNRKMRRASTKTTNASRSDSNRPSYAQGAADQGYLGVAR